MYCFHLIALHCFPIITAPLCLNIKTLYFLYLAMVCKENVCFLQESAAIVRHKNQKTCQVNETIFVIKQMSSLQSNKKKNALRPKYCYIQNQQMCFSTLIWLFPWIILITQENHILPNWIKTLIAFTLRNNSFIQEWKRNVRRIQRNRYILESSNLSIIQKQLEFCEIVFEKLVVQKHVNNSSSSMTHTENKTKCIKRE